MATIQGVYVALFGRPADPTGLAYFNSITNGGQNLASIASLAGTAEFQARFANQNNVQIINSIYQSLFGRDADLAGLNFFADALTKGTLNVNNVAIAILDGAQGNDKTIVANKVAAADLYTKALDTGAEVVAYSGNSAAAQGVTFLKGVTTTVPTAAAVDTAVAAMVTASTGGGTGTAGVTVTLQTGAATDTVSPDQTNVAYKTTAGNDTIRALAAADFASADSIDGGAGTDTLNAVFAANSSVNPVLKSVEVVNYAGPGAAGTAFAAGTGGIGETVTFDAASSTGIQQLNISGVNLTAKVDTAGGAAQGAAVVLNNIDKGTTVGFKDIAVTGGANATDHADLNVTYTNTTGGSDAVTVSVNNILSATNGVLTLNTAQIENVTVNSTGAASSFTIRDAQLQKLTITGDKDLTLLNSSVNTAQKVVDASAFTGVLTYTATGNGETIATGSKADIITLGAGNDTVVYSKVAQSTFANADTINGFAAGTSTTAVDKFDLKALGLASDSTVATTSLFSSGGSTVSGMFNLTNKQAVALKVVDANTVDVYIDVNKDGNFDAANDMIIHVSTTGIGTNVANIDKGDFIFA